MKPPRFRYCAVDSVDEALAALAEHGDEAKVLAGGQSLIPMLNMRLVRPGVLVDVNRIGGLDGIAANGRLEIGALARQRAVERSGVVREHAPLLVRALHHVAHAAIRSRGTIGGSAAHADPAGEIPAVLRALDAEIRLRGSQGERLVPAERFFVSPLTTDARPDELLVGLSIAPEPAGSRSTFLEIARRHGDFALVGVAAAIELDGGGAVARARICFSNVGEVPHRADAAERFLAGARIEDPAVRHEAAELAVEGTDPSSDLHATAEDRRDLARVLARRALEALAAEGGSR